MTTMKNADRIAKITFILYIALMLWLLFGQRVSNDVQGGYWDELSQNINLVPFRTIGRYMDRLYNSAGKLNHQAVINLGGNVIMFIPLGFLLPFVSDRAKKLKNCFVMTFALLMLVETVQLFTLLGSFDIDDLLLNIIGIMLGYVIYVKISK